MSLWGGGRFLKRLHGHDYLLMPEVFRDLKKYSVIDGIFLEKN
jgi:hypothetical protein